MVKIELRYVYEDVDRHGNVRVYFWRGRGHPKTRIRDPQGSDDFFRTYRKLLAGGATQSDAPILTRPRPGTLRALIADYYASPKFKSELSKRTQYVRRGLLDGVCIEPLSPSSKDVFADVPLRLFKPKHARVLRDRKAATPEQANARLKALRQVFHWAISEEHFRGANPARMVDYIRTHSSGFHTWSTDEVERYKARHPVGTKAHLALALLMYSGGRRADVVTLGRQHARDGRLRYWQHKGRRRNPKQRDVPILPELQQVLDGTELGGELTFLVSDWGRPFTSNGFGNRMRKWCDEAELPHCSAHGIRKAAATIAGENGATALQLQAIFGWESIKEADRYTKAASRRDLATGAMHLIVTKNRTDVSHSDAAVARSGKKRGE